MLFYDRILNIWPRKVLIFLHHVINITTAYNLPAVTYSLASSIILPFALQGEKPRAKTFPRNFALYIFTYAVLLNERAKVTVKVDEVRLRGSEGSQEG